MFGGGLNAATVPLSPKLDTFSAPLPSPWLTRGRFCTAQAIPTCCCLIFPLSAESTQARFSLNSWLHLIDVCGRQMLLRVLLLPRHAFTDVNSIPPNVTLVTVSWSCVSVFLSSQLVTQKPSTAYSESCEGPQIHTVFMFAKVLFLFVFAVSGTEKLAVCLQPVTTRQGDAIIEKWKNS